MMTLIEKLIAEGETSWAIERQVGRLTKPQLLAVLEYVPQRYWPPRPTRQDKATLVKAIRHALHGLDRVRVQRAIQIVAKETTR